MSRCMSFSATVDPMRAQTKTVTRRNPTTWKNLQPGDRLTAVEKAMGLPRGTKQVVIGEIEVTGVRVEPLFMIEWEQDANGRLAGPGREGFSSLHEFKAVWVDMAGGWDPEARVRRIEFRHIKGEPDQQRSQT